MNSYVNVLLQTLLSWVRVVARWAWDAILGGDGGIITWIGENWLALTIVLCVVCMVVDAVVHLLRWRWDLVWASFFRRMRHDPGDRRERVREAPAAWNSAQENISGMELETDEAVPQPEYEMGAPDGKNDADIPQETPRGGRLLSLAGRLLASPMGDEGLPEHYQTPALPVDREAAYGEPYIPPQWRRPDEGPTEDEPQ